MQVRTTCEAIPSAPIIVAGLPCTWRSTRKVVQMALEETIRWFNTRYSLSATFRPVTVKFWWLNFNTFLTRVNWNTRFLIFNKIIQIQQYTISNHGCLCMNNIHNCKPNPNAPILPWFFFQMPWRFRIIVLFQSLNLQNPCCHASLKRHMLALSFELWKCLMKMENVHMGCRLSYLQRGA